MADISFFDNNGRHTARYVSATTVFEEVLDHQRLIGLYWSAGGQVQRENVAAGLPGLDPLRRHLETFELEIDGQNLRNGWEWVGASQRAGARAGTQEGVVELRHQTRAITLKVVTRVDDSPILARYLEITNTGTAPAALSSVTPWCGVLWNTPRPTTIQSSPVRGFPANPSLDPSTPPFSVGYFASEEWGWEGDFVWRALPMESFRIERSAHGRTWSSPYYIVKNELTGEMFFMGLAWSGPFFAEFSFRHDTLLNFRLAPTAPAPLRVIAPGETVTSPETHIGALHGSLDDGVAAWHAHMRASVVPPRPAGKSLFTVSGRVVETTGEWILREVDIAAEMGAEAFEMDAGWYGEKYSGNWGANRGDWNEGDWLPGGMAGIRDYIHSKGMLFGLWQEPEALSPSSNTAQAHPDWYLKSGDLNVGERLDLANPEAARYFEDSVRHVLRDFQVDYYKIDYNVTTGEGGQHARDGYQENEYWRHYETLYRLFDNLRKEFPAVAFENCAGGGGRNDLGMAARFDYNCESDWSAFPYSIRAINALSLFLPPETLIYYHNHLAAAHHYADMETHLRVTLFATPFYVGFGAQGADRNTAYFDMTRRYIELNKTFCRTILGNHPAVFHHTPDIGVMAPADWCVLEYAARDHTRGYAGLFNLSGQQSDYLFRPRGIDISLNYAVTFDNLRQTVTISGIELANAGLRIRVEGACRSELIMYEVAAK